MLWFRPAEERRHAVRQNEVWLTFDPSDRADPLAHGFGALEILAEDRFPACACIVHHARRDADVVTYVREGALQIAYSLGPTVLVLAGEFHRTSVKAGTHITAMNASGADTAHTFQCWLRPSYRTLDPGLEQRRFPTNSRGGALFAVASPDGRNGSLRLHQNTIVYSSLLEPGRHVIHELDEGRSGWLHVVDGSVRFDGVVLHVGDGVGISNGSPVSFTTRSSAEILFFDLEGALPLRPANDVFEDVLA